MSDKAESLEAGKKGGWLKGIIGTLAGLLSGAFMMYLSPLIDRVIKPSKPLANFAIDHQDLNVTFHNRSTGSSQGWWDFGDGSPLEPLDPKQEIVTHTYQEPGTYTAKLSVHNLFGEESERTVQVNLAPGRTERPAVLSLDVASVSPGDFAPATFKVTGTTKNADACVWELGEDRPLEFSTEKADKQERLVTFDKPGGYVIKFLAVSGNQAEQKTEVVWVNEPPNGSCAVVLHCTDTATKVERIEVPMTVAVSFPPDAKDAVYKFDRQVPARPGFTIADAKIQTVADAGARNLRVQVAPDKRFVDLLGELPKPSGAGTKGKTGVGTLLVRVVLTQERRTSVSRAPVAMSATMTVPGNAIVSLPPLPEGWVDAQRQLRLELRDGDRSVWQGSQLPHGVPVQVHQHPCSLTAATVGNQVRVDLVPARGLTPAAN